MTGETRLVNGQLAMCISPCASYGGGSGPLWAIENQECQFTARERGIYFEGICRKVLPKELKVTIEILNGGTWGDLSSGNALTLHVDEIGRYHVPTQHSRGLISESRKHFEEKNNALRFYEISSEQLSRDISSAYEASINKILAVDDYKQFEELLMSYKKLTVEIKERKDCFMFDKSHPLMNARDQFRRKLKAFIQSNSKN